MQKVLVTGGSGYIGSHTVIALFNAGYQPVIIDDLSNSQPLVVDRIEAICGRRPPLHVFDLRDTDQLDALFKRYHFDSVIHFAGLKAVGESVEQPLRYYACNIQGTLSLLSAMTKFGCSRLVFSSSASVYGNPAVTPISEDAPVQPTNPYARSKLMIEDMLRDLSASRGDWNISLLRYFNPVAAHPSGLIGEHPNGVPSNLLPYIAQVGIGLRKFVAVFGNDYETHDGTGVRDYLHVMDLADAHIKALSMIEKTSGCTTYNIGTGKGYSVLDMINAFEVASGVSIPYRIEPRRAGDVASCFADVSKSEAELGWKAKYDLPTMMQDHWRWQSNNPNGYGRP